MGRLGAIIMVALLLVAVVPSTIALASPSEGLIVPETSAVISVDGSLNMTAEWNGSIVVTWSNPLDGNEYDVVYLLHNATHYLFAAILYDPDNINDDFFEVHVSWDSIIYRYVVSEGSATVELFNVTNGEEALSSNATGVMTSSSPSQHRLYVELAIPKEEWGYTATAYLLFIHRHTFKIDTTSKYPEAANTTDPSTWLRVDYRVVLGEYKVVLTFKDRDGDPIDYVAERSYAAISFLNGTTYATVSPTSSSVEVLLPPENYTITFYVYGIPVFNASIEVNDNVTATYVLENLKHVAFPFGEVIGVVEYPGVIESIYLEPMNQLGLLITNSTEPTALRLFPRATWNFTFVTALNALNFTYNPFTMCLLAYTRGNLSGVMMVGAPKGYPVFYFANGTVRGYVFNHVMEELSAWISNGTYRIYNSEQPFAITINGTALRRGTDYSVDPFNITTINVGSGELRIYYVNPAEVYIVVADSKARVVIATPYSFRGRYTLKVFEDGRLVKSFTGSFTSTAPLTTIERTLDLESGTYMVEVTVTDEDSGQTIGSASTSYEVVAAPTIPEVGWEYYLLLLVIALLAVAIVVSLRVARHTIEEAREKRYVKRKGG